MSQRQQTVWLSRIRAASRAGRMPADEATVLEDMVHAERPAAEPIIQFVARYLPTFPKVADHGVAGKLQASDSEAASAKKRALRDPLNSRIMQELISRCDGYRQKGGPGFIDWQERRNPQLWKKRFSHWTFGKALQDLAWAWRFTGTTGYADTAKGLLLTLARNRFGWGPLGCNYGNPYNGWLNDNLLDMGHATLGPAIAYDLLRERFNTAERNEIAAYYEPYFYRALVLRYYGITKPGNNFAPIGFGGVGLMALALTADIPRVRRGVLEECLAWAEAYARFTLDHVGGSDGAAVEGSAYGSASLYYIALFADGLRRRCGRDLFTHPAWGRFARYLAIETLPGGGAFNNFNDNHYRTHVSYWPLVARRSGDHLCDWVWANHMLGGSASDTWLQEGRTASISELPLLLLYRKSVADLLAPPGIKPQLTHLFPDQQHLVIRSGWKRDDLHVSFQCTRGRAGGHSQADRLNVTLYALGERFLVDSGYGMVPIPGSSEVRRLGALAVSHNQVLIDGEGQIQSISPNAGRIVARGQKGNWIWALGDAVGSYKNVRIARRLIVVHRDATHPCMVMADWLAPEDDKIHRFDWLLHTAPGNRFQTGGGAGKAVISGAHGKAMQLLHLAGSAVRLSRDEWIDHPRLTAVSRNNYFLALSVIGTGSILKTADSPARRAVAWSSGPHAAEIEITGVSGITKGVRPGLRLKPLGLTLDMTK